MPSIPVNSNIEGKFKITFKSGGQSIYFLSGV